MTYAAVAGSVFLLFFLTHTGFQAAAQNADSTRKSVESRIEKAAVLAAEAQSSKGKSTVMNSGLLSFLQSSAEQSGMGNKVSSIRPKNLPGAREAATIRLENLTYNEALTFLMDVEQYTNLNTNNIRLSKRFDNNQFLNLVMDIIKK